MSITKYFVPLTTRESANAEALEAGKAAAEAVIMAGKDEIAGRKRKRASTAWYDADVKTKMAKHALIFGNKSAVEKFSKELGHRVPEATVRNYKRNLQAQLKEGKNMEDISVMATSSPGRPLLLPKPLDDLTKQLVFSLHVSGSPISADIILAAAEGIVRHRNPSLLQAYSGQISLTKTWARLFLARIGYVKRKGTRTARHTPSDFPAVKSSFLEKISEAKETHNIPESMVVNCDQTGAKMIPVSQWTLAESGSRQVDIVAMDDKR